MIRLVAHKDIDFEAWDATVAAAANSTIFNYSWYLNAICSSWSALVLGDYEVIMPLPINTKYGMQSLHQPFFSRELRVLAKGLPTPETITAFLSAIPKTCRLQHFGFPKTAGLVDLPYQTEEVPHQELALSDPYETIYKGFNTNTKRNIKKAIKADYVLKPLQAPEEIVSLFKATKGGELKVFSELDYQRLLALMQACLKHKRGQMWGVFAGEILCGAGFFMENNGRLTYLKGAATAEGKKHGAMHFLFDSIIKQNAQQLQVLDFGGSKVPSVAKFYNNFGAIDAFYLHLALNRLPAVVKLLKKLKK